MILVYCSRKHIYGLAQDYNNSFAKALELL